MQGEEASHQALEVTPTTDQQVEAQEAAKPMEVEVEAGTSLFETPEFQNELAFHIDNADHLARGSTDEILEDTVTRMSTLTLSPTLADSLAAAASLETACFVVC